MDWAKKNVVLLMLDFPRSKRLDAKTTAQNERLMEKYMDDVPGFPTVLVVNPKGRIIGSLGYAPGGPEPWIKNADSVIN